MEVSTPHSDPDLSFSDLMNSEILLVKLYIGIGIILVLIGCDSSSERFEIDPGDYGQGTKLINVGLCKKGPLISELNSVELATRDSSGVVKTVASGSVDKGGTYTAILQNDLAPGWYALRFNKLANIKNPFAGDLVPIYVDISKFTILYALVKPSIRKAVVSFDQPPVCDIHNTDNNDWFVESHAGLKNIRKFSDGTDAAPVSHAFFAFRHSDSMLLIGRMLDLEIIQTLPWPSEHPTKPSHDRISRTKWIVENGNNGGHQVLDSKNKYTCFGCHENGNVKPASFPLTGTSNICHRCHVGSAGYTNGLYDPSQ